MIPFLSITSLSSIIFPFFPFLPTSLSLLFMFHYSLFCSPLFSCFSSYFPSNFPHTALLLPYISFFPSDLPLTALLPPYISFFPLTTFSLPIYPLFPYIFLFQSTNTDLHSSPNPQMHIFTPLPVNKYKSYSSYPYRERDAGLHIGLWMNATDTVCAVTVICLKLINDGSLFMDGGCVKHLATNRIVNEWNRSILSIVDASIFGI